MRTQTPTSWLLDQRVGFGAGPSQGVAVASGTQSGLVLTADARGPLAVDAPDLSIGRALLPRGLALDANARLYLHDYVVKRDGTEPTAWLQLDSGRVKRLETGFDQLAQFVDLPGVCATQPQSIDNHIISDDAQRHDIHQPPGIAVDDGYLYVADPGLSWKPSASQPRQHQLPSLGFTRQVRVYDLTVGRLVTIWEENLLDSGAFGAQVGEINPASHDGHRSWRPIDVATGNGYAYVLDKMGRVFRAQIGSPALCQIACRPCDKKFLAQTSNWSRIAVGHDCRIYVLCKFPKQDATECRPIVIVLDGEGRLVRNNKTKKPVIHEDAGSLRGLLETPPVISDHRHRIFVSDSLTRPCPQNPQPALNPLVPFGFKLKKKNENPSVFDHRGKRVPMPDISEPPRSFYRRRGIWHSEALDSRISRCQWHRVSVQMPSLPAGTRLRFHSYSDEIQRLPSFIGSLNDKQMDFCHEQVAPVQRRQGAMATGADQNHCEFLIHSRPGRFLWLRVEIMGGGFATPRIESLRAHYPRQSYLDDLPRVYRHDPEGAAFLERFLSVFQTEWDALDDRIENFSAYLTPCAIPAGPPEDPARHVVRLARWLGRELDHQGSWLAQRRLLGGLADGDRSDRGGNRRGTRLGLRQALQAYLQYVTGRTPDQLDRFPVLVEGFDQRHYLTTGGPADYRPNHPLWSRSVVGRMKLGSDRLNQSRLISSPSPQLDVFREHAHRFRVVVPATWLRTKAQRAAFQSAIEAEKPAHTESELSVVEPAFCLGVQSTLGVDAFVGSGEPAVLQSRDQDNGPSLGVNTVLEPPSGAPSERSRSTPVLSGVTTILQPKIGPLR